jgi:hypothetical protein
MSNDGKGYNWWRGLLEAFSGVYEISTRRGRSKHLSLAFLFPSISRVTINISHTHLIDAFLSMLIAAFSIFDAPIISSAPFSRAESPSFSITVPTAFSRFRHPLAVF